jgi:hypothetical protein
MFGIWLLWVGEQKQFQLEEAAREQEEEDRRDRVIYIL